MISTALTDLWYGFGVALQPQNLMWCFVGVLVGNMVGVLPGMGPLAFIVFGKLAGMIPGTFACVFVAALGDRDATWRGAAILAAVVTFFGVALFHYLLKIPMPLLRWDFL